MYHIHIETWFGAIFPALSCNHNLAKVIEDVMDRIGLVEFHNLMPKCAETKSQILQSWFKSVRELLIHLM